MDKRDDAIARVALGLKLVDAGALAKVAKLAQQFPGRSLDLLLELSGIIDREARRKLVLAFNERLRQTPGAPFQPLPLPDAPKQQPSPAPRSGAQPRPATPPPKPAARTPALKQRDLSDSDILSLPPDDDDAVPALRVPGDDDDRFDPSGSDDTTGQDEDAIFAEPTMVLRDDPSPPIVLVESAEVEPAPPPPALSESQEEAIFAEPTMVLRDEPDAKTKGKLSDEDAIYAEPTMVLQDPPAGAPGLAVPDEEAILAEPTMVLQESAELTLADASGAFPQPPAARPAPAKSGRSKSESGPIEVDLRLNRDVSMSESQKLGKSGLPMPGVKSKRGEGPLNREEFQRRLKMRQGFDGFTVGDYKVVTEIARGAFGVVLQVEASGTAKSLARERGYDGNMALKVMLENKTDPRETQRFLDEIKVLIRFDHPHIVRMFDAGVEMGLTYYSMELIKGTETRTHVLKHGPMPPLLAVRVGKEVAAALAYVHQQRTYHRDLKPQNIMLDQRTQPYKALLIDFGLVAEHLSSADKGLILGTPSYMPPEQAQPRGGHGEVNVTSDIYSLGASIYFLLTGQPPFSGKDPKAIIRSVVTEKPRSPDELNPNVPKNVAAIVMKCLEKKQRDRYHGAKQLEADLESALKAGQMMLKAKSFLGKFLGKPPKA